MTVKIRVLTMLTAAVMAVCLISGCGSSAASSESTDTAAQTSETSAAEAGDETSAEETESTEEETESQPRLGSFTPVLRVNGVNYYWHGVGELTDGFSEYGEIKKIVTSDPTEDCELMAEFDASGTIYTNPDAPYQVLVYMTTDWFKNYYVEFRSEELGSNHLLSYGGELYWFSGIEGYNDYEDYVDALPEDAQSIGTAVFAGDLVVPSEDLATNCEGGAGTEIYYSPSNPDVLYTVEPYTVEGVASGQRYGMLSKWTGTGERK